jgi:hypothetical protein
MKIIFMGLLALGSMTSFANCELPIRIKMNSIVPGNHMQMAVRDSFKRDIERLLLDKGYTPLVVEATLGGRVLMIEAQTSLAQKVSEINAETVGLAPKNTVKVSLKVDGDSSFELSSIKSPRYGIGKKFALAFPASGPAEFSIQQFDKRGLEKTALELISQMDNCE